MNKVIRLLLSNNGNSSIEYAILLPLFALISFAAIEFGMYFVKDELTAAAVSNISQAIQRDPTLTNAQLQQLARSYGAGLIQFETAGNYICGRAYSSQAQAQSAVPCNDTNFFVTNPGTPGNAYYIVLSAGLKNYQVTPIASLLPSVKTIHIAQSSGVVQVGNLLPPPCFQPGEYLQWTGSNFKCAAAPPVCSTGGYGMIWNGTSFSCIQLNPPNCSQPWQKLEYGNGQYTCVNVPYVIAAGIAHPNTPGNGSWHTEQSMVLNWPPSLPSGTNSAPDRIALCENNIQFNVPGGLPQGGQMVIQGNLVYDSGNGEGDWHDWVASFENLNAPVNGGQGHVDICMANGGNWIMNGSGAAVQSEHVSWTLTYIPPNAFR